MADKDYYEDDDWDEEDWERFLQKADVRTAKYLELFEHCIIIRIVII